MSIAVVYDRGSASPAELLTSLGETERMVVVVADSEQGRAARNLFEAAGVPVAGLTDDDLPAVLAGHGVKGIVTYSERMLRPTARLAERMGLLFCTPQAADALTDKATQRRLLREEGVDRVLSVTVGSVAEFADALSQAGLPAVVKPARGESSRNTVVLRTADGARELAEGLLAAEGQLVVEEYLRGAAPHAGLGDYVSVESAIVPSGPVHFAVTGKFPLAPPFRETGQYWPAPLTDTLHAEVTELTGRALRALGMGTGLSHTEIKLTATGPRIIEVNGRLGGLQPELALRATGLNPLRIGADLAMRRPVTLEPVRPDRVYFQLFTPGPTAPGTLLGISGGKEVRALPGVTGYRTFSRAGAPVGGTGSNWLDLTVGVVDDHDALVSLAAKVTGILRYEFDHAGRHVVRSAADLISQE